MSTPTRTGAKLEDWGTILSTSATSQSRCQIVNPSLRSPILGESKLLRKRKPIADITNTSANDCNDETYFSKEENKTHEECESAKRYVLKAPPSPGAGPPALSPPCSPILGQGQGKYARKKNWQRNSKRKDTSVSDGKGSEKQKATHSISCEEKKLTPTKQIEDDEKSRMTSYDR